MNYMRQAQLLDPSLIDEKSVSIAGVGATGSYAALLLAQLGWGNTPQRQGKLKLYDADKVEEHNICNQAFGLRDIGKLKVEAMNEIIVEKCGFEVQRFPEMVVDQAGFASTYNIILTDTMKSRGEIFDKCLQYKFNADLVIETRMGLKEGRVYAFNPHNQNHVDKWKETLYKDEEAETSACGASSSIATTAAFVASLAVSRIIHHFDVTYGRGSLKTKSGYERKMWNEVIFGLYPESFMVRTFDGEDPQVIQ